MIKVENIAFHYPEDRDDDKVFEEVSFELKSGEVLAVTGAAGEGKSTLLKIMAGLLKPTEGSIVRQVDNIGMTFQRGGLFDGISAGDNLRLPLKENFELTKEQIDSRVAERLSQVGLGGTENLRISEMSGGMQKRLALARALLLEPKVLLLDEPTAGLDPVTARTIWDLIFQTAKTASMTILFGLSDPFPILDEIDRMAFLHHGRLRAIDTPAALRRAQDPIFSPFLRKHR